MAAAPPSVAASAAAPAVLGDMTPTPTLVSIAAEAKLGDVLLDLFLESVGADRTSDPEDLIEAPPDEVTNAIKSIRRDGPHGHRARTRRTLR